MGPLSDSRGYVRLEKVQLEDGTTRTALRTHPKWVGKGTIKGWHNPILLPTGARFEAEVGFAEGAQQSDGVRFMVFVHHDGGWVGVVDHRKAYSGNLDPIVVDLSRFEGKEIRIELRVDAGGTAAQDWAVWVNPRITGRR